MQLVVPGLWLFDEISGTVNAYLWQRADGYTLIDTGLPNHAPRILAALAAANLAAPGVDRIILTHCDVDHMGGAAQIQTVNHSQIIAHAAEVPNIRGQRARVLPKTAAGYAMRPLMAASQLFFKVRPVTVDEMVLEKQVLVEGFQVLHVPGHTAGQMALYHPARKLLITADALANRQQQLSGPAPMFTPDMMQAKESIRKLAKLDVDVACFGHGPPIVGGAGEKIRAFAATLV
jgi:glyoxylase-like metal-dependent hydrolase (beta-lactamase superfamily II)